MRVVQANKAYLPHLGGIETIVRQLAEGIATRGHESTVVACSDDRSASVRQINGVEARYTPTIDRIASLPISPQYPAELMRSDADILHIHEPSLLPSFAYITRRRLAEVRFKRLVVWWHSDIIRQQALQPFYSPLLHKLLRAADAIVVATPKHVTSSSFLPDYAQKCRVIHFGVEQKILEDDPKLEVEAAAIRAKYDRPIVLFAGRLVYYKGAEYLIDAMRGTPEAHLVLVGKGPLQPHLEKLAAACPGNVTFIPYLADRDFQAMFRACTIFAMPSVENSEAFGIVQLEAMAHGKPVITSDLETGVTYVNQNNITGLVVPRRDSLALAEALKRLLRDETLRNRLGETAKRRVAAEFTVDAMVDKTIALYEELLSVPSR